MLIARRTQWALGWIGVCGTVLNPVRLAPSPNGPPPSINCMAGTTRITSTVEDVSGDVSDPGGLRPGWGCVATARCSSFGAISKWTRLTCLLVRLAVAQHAVGDVPVTAEPGWWASAWIVYVACRMGRLWRLAGGQAQMAAAGGGRISVQWRILSGDQSRPSALRPGWGIRHFTPVGWEIDS
jgi:hypothetical protein